MNYTVESNANLRRYLDSNIRPIEDSDEHRFTINNELLNNVTSAAIADTLADHYIGMGYDVASKKVSACGGEADLGLRSATQGIQLLVNLTHIPTEGVRVSSSKLPFQPHQSYRA